MALSPSTPGQMVSRSSTQSFKWLSSTAYTLFYLLRTTGFLSTRPVPPQAQILPLLATIYLIITVCLDRAHFAHRCNNPFRWHGSIRSPIWPPNSRPVLYRSIDIDIIHELHDTSGLPLREQPLGLQLRIG